MAIKRIGKKTKEWLEAKQKLIEIYKEKGIVRCERCGSDWILSFHHLDRRSSGKAEHTFKRTRLLCCRCHEICECSQKENEILKKMR